MRLLRTQASKLNGVTDNKITTKNTTNQGMRESCRTRLMATHNQSRRLRDPHCYVPNQHAMIVPTDPDYQLAKLLKTGRTNLQSPFNELATWIRSEYGAYVLNVAFDRIAPDNRPRLSVVFERTATQQRFCAGLMGNFDARKQDAIRKRFGELAIQTQFPIPDIDRLLVIFQSFESVARIEVNDAIPDSRILDLKTSLNDTRIWEIWRCFDAATFFFFTDTQVATLTPNVRAQYVFAYNQLAQQFDEFGYIADNGLNVQFDSKENLDKNFGGNWFNYYR